MPGIYNEFTGSQRMKAYRWLMAEYAAGRRTKPVHCDVCEQTAGHIEPHSEDYSAPYGDNIGRYGLCYRCHMILHCRFRNPAAFERYCQTLADGYRYVPIATRNFPMFLGQHCGKSCAVEREQVGHPLPGFLVLLEDGRRVLADRSGQPLMF